MFQGYLKFKPVFFQIALFLSFNFVLILLGIYLSPLLLKLIYHANITDISSFLKSNDPKYYYGQMLLLATNSIFCFLLPALVFAYLADPQPKYYLGLGTKPSGKAILGTIFLSVGFILFALPLQQFLSNIHLGAFADKMQKDRDDTLGPLLAMNATPTLFINILVLGLLAAFAEELYFRAVIFRLAASFKRTNWVKPICVSAFLFTYFHFTIYGAATIFIAGCLLAYLYKNTGSLWSNVLFHFLNNSINLLLTYLTIIHPSLDSIFIQNKILIPAFIVGIVLLPLAIKFIKQNNTSLPENWSAFESQDKSVDEMSDI